MKFQVLKPRPRTPALLNLQRRVVYTLFSIYTHYGEEAMYEVLDHAAESLPRRQEEEGCQGHETTQGPAGISTFCDGSCNKENTDAVSTLPDESTPIE